MLNSKFRRRSDAVAAIERHNAKGGVQYRLGLAHHNGQRWYCVNVNLSN